VTCLALLPQEEMDKRWQVLRNDFLRWNETYHHLNMPVELNDVDRCIQLGKMPCFHTQSVVWKTAYGALYKFLRINHHEQTETDLALSERAALHLKKKGIDEAAKIFAQSYQKPAAEAYAEIGRPMHSDDVIQAIKEHDQIQFIVLGEHHDDPASWLWLDENKKALADAGVSTIAMEFYGIFQKEELDAFYEGTSPDAPPAKGVLLGNPMNDFLEGKALLLEQLKMANIRAIGIETEESVEANKTLLSHGAPRNDRIVILDKALPFALSREGLLPPPEKKKVLIWVGAAHVPGMVAWLGASHCMTLNIHANKSPSVDCQIRMQCVSDVIVNGRELISSVTNYRWPIQYAFRHIRAHQEKPNVRRLYDVILALMTHGLQLQQAGSHPVESESSLELAKLLWKKANAFFDTSIIPDASYIMFCEEMLALLQEKKLAEKITLFSCRDIISAIRSLSSSTLISESFAETATSGDEPDEDAVAEKATSGDEPDEDAVAEKATSGDEPDEDAVAEKATSGNEPDEDAVAIVESVDFDCGSNDIQKLYVNDIKSRRSPAINMSMQILGGVITAVGCFAVAIAFILLHAATLGIPGLIVAALGAASILAGLSLFASGTYKNSKKPSNESFVNTALSSV
jgi:hypothetical protein